jgi:hypothetical protein
MYRRAGYAFEFRQNTVALLERVTRPLDYRNSAVPVSCLSCDPALSFQTIHLHTVQILHKQSTCDIDTGY